MAARFLGEVARTPAALAVAAVRGTPGTSMHLRCACLAAAAALRGRGEARNAATSALVFPMDSVRYFEFDFAWRRVARLPHVERYLDVSSPRMFPLCLIASAGSVEAHLANPDEGDLGITRALAGAAGLQGRCTFHAATVAALDLPPGSFDLITCLSVLEHVPSPDDAASVARLWALLRPGGRLILTLPVAREAFDEYLDLNDYGLLPTDADGWSFGQRVHDAASLDATLRATTGAPSAVEVFGERVAGAFVADRARKASGGVALWKEPLRVARDYARFASIDALPGWGVVGLEFQKNG
jgi:SAM-dependent methyltransferase